jgi:ATP-binding cassette subfamily F protein uup
VLLVSHDRAFLNEVVASTLVFEGNGYVKEYAGGYDDWINQRQAQQSQETQNKSASASSRLASRTDTPPRPRKLSFKEQKELEQLPQQIERMEHEQSQLHATMAQPEFYQNAKSVIAETAERLEQLQLELTTAYKRWESLEACAQ